jgi:chromosome segregation ATPase
MKMKNEIMDMLKSIQQSNLSLKEEFHLLKEDVHSLKADVSSLKQDNQSLKEDVRSLKVGQNNIINRLDAIEDGMTVLGKKTDGIAEQTADLLEFRTDMIDKVDGIRDDLSMVEFVTANNFRDIAKLKAIK